MGTGSGFDLAAHPMRITSQSWSKHVEHTFFTSRSICLSSLASAKLFSISSVRTCSMGSRARRTPAISSRVRYVEPGSLMLCP